MNTYHQKEMFSHSRYYFIVITQEIEIVLWDRVFLTMCSVICFSYLAIAVGHPGFHCTQKIYKTAQTKSSIPKTHPGLGGCVHYVHCCDVCFQSEQWIKQMDCIWGAILCCGWNDRCAVVLDLWIATCFYIISICLRCFHTLRKAKQHMSTSSTWSSTDLLAMVELLVFILLNIYRHRKLMHIRILCNENDSHLGLQSSCSSQRSSELSLCQNLSFLGLHSLLTETFQVLCEPDVL